MCYALYSLCMYTGVRLDTDPHIRVGMRVTGVVYGNMVYTYYSYVYIPRLVYILPVYIHTNMRLLCIQVCIKQYVLNTHTWSSHNYDPLRPYHAKSILRYPYT